ncbi:MAG: hypothetical protein IPK83_14925 [Planctomycetes bacterium]|nr:hypothetical protein [Planctomycetota bacterium]
MERFSDSNLISRPNGTGGQSSPPNAARSADPLAARSPDEREYLTLAVSLSETGELRLPTGEVAKRPPLYPALLSLIQRSQPPETWHSAAILMQSLLAWCNTLLIALIAAKIADARAGLIAGFIAALYAPLLYLQTLFLTETVVIFLLLAATLTFIATIISENAARASNQPTSVNSPRHAKASRSKLPLAMVSALIGLATLARPNAVLFLFPFAAHQLWHMRKKPRHLLIDAIALTLPAALLLGAWTLRNQQLLGRPTLSTIGGLNLYLGHNSDFASNPGLDHADYDRFDRVRREQHLTELQTDDLLKREAFQFIAANPRQMLLNTLTKIKVWFTPTIPSFGPLLPLILSGICLVAGWRRRPTSSSQTSQAGAEQKSPTFTPINAGVGPTISRDDANGINQEALPWRWLVTIAFAVFLFAYIAHLTSSSYRKLPLISPTHVLLLGGPALILFRIRLPVRGLLIALVVTQMIVALAFIPLSRIRWTIDPIFIIAIAVATSHFCNLLKTRRKQHPFQA